MRKYLLTFIPLTPILNVHQKRKEKRKKKTRKEKRKGKRTKRKKKRKKNKKRKKKKKKEPARCYKRMLLFSFCSPHLRFNNLVLISPNGLPGEHSSFFLSSQECFSHKEMAQISLRTWVNVVSAKMTAINR